MPACDPRMWASGGPTLVVLSSYLLAIPIGAGGLILESQRPVFWLVAPPVILGVFGLALAWLLGPHPLGRLVLSYLIGLLLYGAYLLTVFGAVLMDIALSAVDATLSWNYLEIWWVILLGASSVLLFSPEKAQGLMDWLLPGGHGRWFVSYVTLAMPWVTLLAALFQSPWWARWWRLVAGAYGMLAALMFALAFAGFETLTMVLLYAFVFLALNGILAFGWKCVVPDALSQWKPALLGLLVLLVNAFATYRAEALAYEMLLSLVLVIYMSTWLPLFFGFGRVVRANSSGWRVLWLFGVIELPVAYHAMSLAVKAPTTP